MDSPASSELTAGRGKRSWWTLAGWLLIVSGLVAGFASNFAEMWVRWFPAWGRAGFSLYEQLVEGESYYTHGPIIPAVSLLIALLLIRHVKIPIRPSRGLGSAVLGISLLLHLVASLARVNFASGFAFIGVLAGLVLLLWGWGAFRILWFPLAFLFFMVPLPEVSIGSLNFALRNMAATWGVSLANALGVIVERMGDRGNQVMLQGGKSLVIANVCNGLRTIISLLAFGALYAYVCRLRGLWRAGLFCATLIVALVANTIRIVSLIVVADLWNTEIATGWWHETSGVMIFVLAFLLMFGLERLVLWARKALGHPAKVLPLFDGRLRGPEDRDQWSRMVSLVGRPGAVVAGVVVVIVAAGAMWLNQTVPVGLTPDLVREAVPATLRIHGRDVRSREMELDARTLAVLEHPSYIVRSYSEPGIPPVEFCLIFSKDNRKGTHPPDVCLEGGGGDIVTKTDVTTAGGLPCRELILQAGNAWGRHAEYSVIYTYRCGGRYTRSFWVQQFVIFTNGLLHRDSSGALVRVSTPVLGDRAKARQRALDLLGEALKHLDENLP
jgi:EpsI family protein